MGIVVKGIMAVHDGNRDGLLDWRKQTEK